MRALLDINVLLALLDEDHIFHHRAHELFGRNQSHGWASCPLTENSLVRIRTNPNYHPVKERSVAEMIEGLRVFVTSSDHECWPDDFSIRDPAHDNPSMIFGPRQITDLYLLALAAAHRGRLVTLDEGLNPGAVPGAKPEHLWVV